MDRLMVTVSGVRGTVGGTLSPLVACEFGCAFGTMLGAGVRVVIGRDSRPSGPMVRDAVAAGLLACGVDVVDLGVVSTPGAALMTGRLKAAGGIVITASHNPSQYNGIKFLQPCGAGLAAPAAERLKDIWQARRFALADFSRQGKESFNDTTHREHVEAVCAIADVKKIAAKRFKVAVDSVNGAGCEVTPMLLERLGCVVKSINGRPSGVFAHAPEPIEENLKDLCDTVRREGVDIGFAQDADADRLVVVDERGGFIGEEYTLALAAAQALRHRKGALATNLSTSRMVDDIAAAASCRVVRAPTGEANVVEAMMRENCILAGEGNGGVIDPRVAPVRDSLVGMAYVLQYMAETGRRISELVAEIPRYVLLKIKLPCPPGAADEVINRTRREFSQSPGAVFNDADGLRIDLDISAGRRGWVSVRASNTEPIMRIFAEAAEKSQAQDLVARVRKIADAVVG